MARVLRLKRRGDNRQTQHRDRRCAVKEVRGCSSRDYGDSGNAWRA
jgi:hypothetical protein